MKTPVEMTTQLKKKKTFRKETFRKEIQEMKKANRTGPRPYYGGWNRQRQKTGQGRQQQERQDTV